MDNEPILEVIQKMQNVAELQAIVTASFYRGLLGQVDSLGAASITSAWVASGALRDILNSPAETPKQLSSTEPTTSDEWTVWAASFGRGMKPFPLSNASYIPVRVINAIIRGAGIVAQYRSISKERVWLKRYEDGFRYNDRFVSGFDEWVALIINGGLRLDGCHMVGKKYADELLNQLRQVYGKGVSDASR